MIGFVGDDPRSVPAHLMEPLLHAMGELSLLHADGWGLATGGRRIELRAGISPFAGAGSEAVRSSAASRVGILYLRFASRGAAVTPENLQPFVRGHGAFAHNGALVPRDAALDALTPAERAQLRGTTDSEVYAALVRRELQVGTGSVATRIARAAGRVRELYPSACLNALLMHGGGLWVVHSPGSVPPPLAAFAARGWTGKDLPPHHDDGYNVLSSARLGRTGVVATSGLPEIGWSPLATDTVHRMTPDGPTDATPIGVVGASPQSVR